MSTVSIAVPDDIVLLDKDILDEVCIPKESTLPWIVCWENTSKVLVIEEDNPVQFVSK